MKNTKKSFTLIEMLISITLFSIIIIFLYDTLDLSKKSNAFFENKLNIEKQQDRVKKIFFEDIINANKLSIKIYEDKNKNTILTFQSKNIYHNSFYKYITYFVSKEDNLIRIESKNEFKKDNNFQNREYFSNILVKNVTLFETIFKDKKSINIVIKGKKVTKTHFYLAL